MRLNEAAQISFEMDPDILEESFEIMNKTSINKVYLDICFQIKLVEIEKSSENSAYQAFIFDLNESDLYNISMEHKYDANVLFKNKLIRTSFQRYKKAIQFLILAEQILNDQKAYHRLNTIAEECTSPKLFNQDFEKKVLELKSQLYCNIAACQLKTGNFKGVVKNCTKCLEIGYSKNSKALFRRAQAYINLQDFDEAIDDLTLAISIDDSSQELKNSLANVQQLKKKYCSSLSANLKKLF